MSKGAPPLGNLDRSMRQPVTPAKLPRPVVKELIYVAPTEAARAQRDAQYPGQPNVGSTPTTAPPVVPMTFSGVDPLAAPSTMGPTEQRDAQLGVPLIRTVDSVPELPVNVQRVQQLGGDESTPFNYTGYGAGQVGTAGTTIQPGIGAAKYDGKFDEIARPAFSSQGSAGVVLSNSGSPTYVQGYSEGLTTSQQNSRNFFNGLQPLRDYIAPHMLPALQYVPQQLAPSVAGGFSATAETKGPTSWLMGEQTEDINFLKGDFGASGQGLLGGIGWLFGRITNIPMGIALDTSRGAASIIEGGNAGFTELFKSGDLNKALGMAEGALLENYNANAPKERGMYTKSIGGSTQVGDFFAQSFTGAALTGMVDYSFSGNGNNPLLTGDANRNVVLQKENFNPFGFRDPIRGGFQTGALEDQERRQGKQNFLHGYDQLAKGTLGIGADILLGGRIDKAVMKLVKPATKVTTTVVNGGKAVAPSVSRSTPVTPRALPALPGRTQLLQLPPAREIPKGTWVTPPTGSPAPLSRIPSAPIARPASNVNQTAMDDYVRRAKEYYSRKNPDPVMIREQGGDLMRRRQDYNSPIQQRYLPEGADPFATKVTRVYRAESGWGGVDFGDGGTLVPYSGSSKMVPATLGVGGLPGGIPTRPRAGVVSAGVINTPPVTMYDEVTGTFSVKGGTNTQERIFVSPGKSPVSPIVDDIIEGTVVDTKALPQGASSKPVIEDITNSTLITPANKAVEASVSAVGKNVPVDELTPPVAPVGGLRGDVSDSVPTTPTKEWTVDPVTGAFTRNSPEVPIAPKNNSNSTFDDAAWDKAFKEEQAAEALIAAEDARLDRVMSVQALPPVVPRNTPNYTVTPSPTLADDLVADYAMDPSTGVFSGVGESSAVSVRKATPITVRDGERIVSIPRDTVEYVTAEAISPSVTSADIVRRLTSGDDIPGAVYNPRQVERGERTISSLVSLARRVTLPGGVPILSESVKDISVMKFARLQQKVEQAIVSSGMNPSSQEAASIRRLFDKNGKALPTNLSPDFSIQVGPRGVDNAASYVTPAKVVAPDAVQWTGRASRYEPEIPLSSDYAIGVRVRYDEELNRIVPLDGGVQAKMIPAVRSEPISGARLRELPVMDRQAVLSKSATDGFTIPKGAIDDAFSPDMMTDVVAAKDYVRSNIPKGDAPLRLDRTTREQLVRHKDIVDDIDYHNTLIEDVSTQLTDVEKSLNKQLKYIDEALPDIGTQHLADDVPFSPLLPSPAKRNTIQSILYDVEDVVDGVPAPGITAFGTTGPDGVLTLARGTKGNGARSSVISVTPDQLPIAIRQHDMFGYNFKDVPGTNVDRTFITDLEGMTKGVGTVPKGMTDSDILDMFSGGSYLTPTVRQTGVDTFEVLSGGDYIAAYKRAVALEGVVDRMSVRMVNGKVDEAVQGISGANLYHGTRVSDLQLRGVDPLQGAARSEYGTGVWLTTSQEIATSAAGRRAPNNHIPNVAREYSESSFLHEVPVSGLDGMSIVRNTDNVRASVADDISSQIDMNRGVFSEHVPYGDSLADDIVYMLDESRTKGLSYGELFGRVDDLTHKNALRSTGSRADEFELTYVQRVVTDMLQSSGVDGITNGTNTALYSTAKLTSRVHDITDVVGGSGDEVALALHNVNLLQKSSDAEPLSKLLKVQLEEAKAVAASRVRDGLEDELSLLNSAKTKAVSDLLDADDVIREIGKTQRGEALIEATVRNEDTYRKFQTELSKDFTGPCL